MSGSVSSASPAIKCLSVLACIEARSKRNALGIRVWPMCNVNACSLNVSRPARGRIVVIQAQSFKGPMISMLLVRTVRCCSVAIASRFGARRAFDGPETRYSVSRDRRLGRKVRIVGIALDGAPFFI
jgi:hypothetical protein